MSDLSPPALVDLKKVLVVDECPMFRDLLATALRCAECASYAATSALEGLRLATEVRPDVILLDVEMAAFGGIACLRCLRRNPVTRKTPIIVVTGLSSRTAVLQCASLGVQGYVLKDKSTLQGLLVRISECLNADARPRSAALLTTEAAPTETPGHRAEPGRLPEPGPERHPQVLRRDRTELLDRIAAQMELRALPPVLDQVISATKNPATTISDLVGPVGQDPALAIHLLKAANSAFYGGGRPVASISEAVHRVGVLGVRNMALAMITIERFTESSVGGLIPQRFWEHSLATAVAAELLAEHVGIPDPPQLFLAGLMHDVGRLVLGQACPEEYQRALHLATERKCDVEVVEREIFGMLHTEVTRSVLEKWQIVPGIVAAATAHDQGCERLLASPAGARAALCVSMANRLAHAAVVGDSGNEMLLPFGAIRRALGLPTEAILTILARTVERSREAGLLFAMHFDGTFRAPMIDELRGSLSRVPSVAMFGEPGGADPASVFCGRLGLIDQDNPGAAILWAESDRVMGRRVDLLLESEAKLGRRLPAGLVCEGPLSPHTCDRLQDRPTATIVLPALYTEFIDAFAHLAPDCPPTEVDEPLTSAPSRTAGWQPAARTSV